jgi:hypothetical protein
MLLSLEATCCSLGGGYMVLSRWRLLSLEAALVGGYMLLSLEAACCSRWRLLSLEAALVGGCSRWRLQAALSLEAALVGGCSRWRLLSLEAALVGGCRLLSRYLLGGHGVQLRGAAALLELLRAARRRRLQTKWVKGLQ